MAAFTTGDTTTEEGTTTEVDSTEVVSTGGIESPKPGDAEL
jgi:hypothetical protein